MPKDTIHTFLTLPLAQRLQFILDDKHSQEIKTYLGPSAFQEYMKIARKGINYIDQEHLGIYTPKNLIFVPGVMGSLLESRTLGGVWWIDVRTRKHLNDLRLTADGMEDANPAHQIFPSNVDTTYEAFLEAVLEQDDFNHDLFPYDWRKPLKFSTATLRDKILTMCDGNGHKPIHLVAHSMGGLMVRATLMEYGSELWPRIGRIVFIGTPHYGSQSIGGYLKNHLWGFDLMVLLSRYISRETFRSLWGVLSMLPAPQGIYPGTRPGSPLYSKTSSSQEPTGFYNHPCANFNMYRAESWGLNLSPVEILQLQRILDGVAEFHQKMYQYHYNLEQDWRDRMAVIAGVGYKTLFSLKSQHSGMLSLWTNIDKVKDRIQGDLHRDGDGSVPLASASLEYVGETRYVKGIHGGLPNTPEVYKDVFRWLRGKSMKLPKTPIVALSEHLAADTGISEIPHLDGTARVLAGSDDAGNLDQGEPDSSHIAELQAKLEAGELQEFKTVRLL